MKNVFYVLLIISMISYTSCNKELEIDAATELNQLGFKVLEVEIDNNMLIFETIDEYQEALDYLGEIGIDNWPKWEEAVDFVSRRASFDNTTIKTDPLIPDPLFATILNNKFEIQIGEFIYQLDPIKDRVISFAVDSDTKAKRIYSDFSFDDEVLAIVQGLPAHKDDKCEPFRNDYCDQTTSLGTDIDAWTRYYKAGIYSSLYLEIKTTEISTSYVGWEYREDGYWDNGSSRGDLVKGTGVYGSQKSYYESIYHQWRDLRDYEIYVEFYYDAIGTWNCDNYCTYN